MQQIQALRFDCEQVGKHVKGSKKRYTWEVALKDKTHLIVLDFSFISGKVKITVDRKILLENELPANVSFQYPFTLDGFALNIIQQGETFELRLNNKVFSHLYTQQKTNTEFKKYESEVKDIKVDHAGLNTGKQKISLNIGAFGGVQKRKKEAAGEGQDWNAFGGSSFPNYFGEAVAVEKPKVEVVKTNLLDEADEGSSTNPSEITSIVSRVEPKQSESLFEFGQPSSPPKQAQPSEEFGNMQEMFKSLNVAAQPTNEIDFFAEEPKKEVKAETGKTSSNDLTSLFPPSAGFDFTATSPNNGGFATGFGLNAGSQINAKSFATTNFNASKQQPFDLSGGLLLGSQPVKHQPTAFSKKTFNVEPASYSQTDSFFTAQVSTAQETKVVDPLTDININDFNTMQKLFQTNNQQFNFTQPNPVYGQPTVTQPTFNLPTQPQPFAPSPVSSDFNTMQLMFQTSNFSSPSEPAPKPSVNPLDMFSNNKPVSFSTMGGNQSGGFDMASFGTMQVGAKTDSSFNFLQTKPAQSGQNSSGDLI